MEKDNVSISVIIAAAGSATRLNSKEKSKQFVLLNGKSLLLHSLEKIEKIRNVSEIIVVTNDVNATEEMLKNEFKSSINLKVVQGGKLRQDSVFNGFREVAPSSKLVLVHDVARPLFDIQDAETCISEALATGAAVLAVQVVDTLKSVKLDKDKLIVNKTIDRVGLYSVQTPQIISYNLLSQAYKHFWRNKDSVPIFTDEASMIEMLNKPVSLVIGDKRNIKITYAEDLELASMMLSLQPLQRKERVTVS